MIELQNVSKSFGSIKALDDVSIKIEKGEFVFITGPSGAGKSTIINLLLAKYKPSSGKILIEDKDVSSLHPKQIPTYRQNIGVVFQDFKVLPERTVRENVQVALAVSGVAPEEWRARVNKVLKLVGLRERAGLFPAQLSGGELQRVSLARALVVNPKIILADEPTGNLDWETADKIMELFAAINKEGKTIIMATHHQKIVEKTDKRVIKLENGKIITGTKTKKEKKNG